jgi:hypothetical protein
MCVIKISEQQTKEIQQKNLGVSDLIEEIEAV